MNWKVFLTVYIFSSTSISNNSQALLYSSNEITQSSFCQEYQCKSVQTVLPPKDWKYLSILNEDKVLVVTQKKNRINISLSYNIDVQLPKEKNATQLEIIRKFVILAAGISLKDMGFERACLQMIRPELLSMSEPDFGSYSDRGLAGIYRIIRKRTNAGWVRVMCGTFLGNGPGWNGISIDAINEPKRNW
jgi:hypothetical protein